MPRSDWVEVSYDLTGTDDESWDRWYLNAVLIGSIDSLSFSHQVGFPVVWIDVGLVRCGSRPAIRVGYRLGDRADGFNQVF